MLTNLASAFGVSAPYWADNPLTMAKGEIKIVNINLQNMVGNEDVAVKAELKDGSDIAQLTADTYTVKAQTSDTMVPLKISIPKETAAGTIKTVKVEFKTIALENQGMVNMGTGMSVSFNVIISEETAKQSGTARVIIIVLALLIAITLVILIATFIIKTAKKRNN